MTAQATSLHSAFLAADRDTHEVTAVTDRVQRDHSTAVADRPSHCRVTLRPATQVHRQLASHSTQKRGARPSISATSPGAVPE